MGRVDGKVALVTGSAARGIGRACVERLAREGALVYGSDLRVALGRAETERLASSGLDVHFVPLDVTDEQQWQGAIDSILAHAGRLDIVVNNAGVAIATSIADTTLEQFRWVNDINLKGTFYGVKFGIEAMRRAGHGGSIVNLSSVAGHVGLRNYVHYCASKGGVKNLTKAAALECGARGDGIRVNSVHPGPIWTSLQEGLAGASADLDAFREATRKMTPLQLLAEPDDVAGAVLFLASDESSYMTGAALTIDGGFTAG